MGPTPEIIQTTPRSETFLRIITYPYVAFDSETTFKRVVDRTYGGRYLSWTNKRMDQKAETWRAARELTGVSGLGFTKNDGLFAAFDVLESDMFRSLMMQAKKADAPVTEKRLELQMQSALGQVMAGIASLGYASKASKEMYDQAKALAIRHFTDITQIPVEMMDDAEREAIQAQKKPWVAGVMPSTDFLPKTGYQRMIRWFEHNAMSAMDTRKTFNKLRARTLGQDMEMGHAEYVTKRMRLDDETYDMIADLTRPTAKASLPYAKENVHSIIQAGTAVMGVEDYYLNLMANLAESLPAGQPLEEVAFRQRVAEDTNTNLKRVWRTLQPLVSAKTNEGLMKIAMKHFTELTGVPIKPAESAALPES